MPLYVYRAKENGCGMCKEGFEFVHERGRMVENCLVCSVPVVRVITSVMTLTNVGSDAKSAGFTTYKRAGEDGTYVKLAGQGPAEINRNENDS